MSLKLSLLLTFTLFFLPLANAQEEYVKKSSAPGRDAADALSSLTVHPELEAQLFASEPLINSPSSIDIDARGRVWACDVVNYRKNQGKRPEGDRILILEDTDHDAKADKVTTFYQGNDIDSAHGICVLGNKALVSAGNEVFYLHDDDHDDQADRKEILFTNIGGAQHDHSIHAFHFGPDGRLYFNFGNAAQRLCDPEGNLITDINGVPCTNENNRPHQEGMVFRCNPDGSNVEMLAWNFRNNWEVAVDSFGTLWQSDNDDDGNQAVRINYVMEYGNFGYKDEITGAGWRDPRAHLEEEIPRRHWHQNDPGVVPDLLVTGAGSPTGICIYEGDLLPEIFHNQIIHCDAGPNVARAYITEPDGAGYKITETVNILTNTDDRWFRPADVSVAPDGSLFVADWYDPGVGGHAMGDIEKGRIYRLIPKDNPDAKPYKINAALIGMGHAGNAYIPWLTSPNEAKRAIAWQSLAEMGPEAEWPLNEHLFSKPDINPRHRARALWLLAPIDPKYIDLALEDEDPNLRITALRAARQTWHENPDLLLSAIEKLSTDPNPQVRRECALALRYLDDEKANQLWAQLASESNPDDRWALEALGIGADLHWQHRLAAWENGIPAPQLITRARTPSSAAQIAAAALNADPADTAPHLRALHFQPEGDTKTAAFITLFEKGDSDLALFAAGQLGPKEIAALDGGKVRLNSLFGPMRGTAEFVRIADRLNLRGFDEDLIAYIETNPNTSEAVTAARMLLGNTDQLARYLNDHDQPLRAGTLARALGRTGDRSITKLFRETLAHPDTPPSLKRDLVEALASYTRGGEELITLAGNNQLPDDLKPLAALALARSPDKNLREAAAQSLPIPNAVGADDFPPLPKLMKTKANAKAGQTAFTQATCNTCHRVNGEGIDFGPDLSDIGNKLSKQAMFESILYPSAGISHGFHGVSLVTKSGTTQIGYITGETDDEITLRMAGGVSQAFARADIKSQTTLEQSLMPPGLAAILGPKGLADLVAHLQSLKSPQPAEAP